MNKMDLNDLVNESKVSAQYNLDATKSNVEDFQDQVERLMTSFHC